MASHQSAWLLSASSSLSEAAGSTAAPEIPSLLPTAEFGILNTKVILLNTKFIILNTNLSLGEPDLFALLALVRERYRAAAAAEKPGEQTDRRDEHREGRAVRRRRRGAEPLPANGIRSVATQSLGSRKTVGKQSENSRKTVGKQ